MTNPKPPTRSHVLCRTLAVTTVAAMAALVPFRGALRAAPEEGETPAAADVAPEDVAPEDVAPEEAGQAALDREQDVIAQRFQQFERNLLVMARYLRKVQPERADLIERAIKQSRGRGLAQQMQKIVELLESGALGDAVDRQGEVVGELRSLLKLLQSGDRMDEIEKEKERLKDLIKDLNRVIRNEEDVRAGTERGGDPDDLAERQGKVAGQAGDLVDKIDGQDAERNADGEPGEGQPGEGKPGEGKPSEGKPGEGKPGEGKPGEGKPGEGKPGEGKPGEGKPGEGKPGEGKPGEGKPGEGKPGEGKPGEGKPGEGKPGEGKPGEGKPGEGKPGEGKPGEGKPGEGKPGEGKPGEGKPGEGKPGEGKPGEGKPGEGKPGEGKPGESGPQPSSDQYPEKTPGRNEIENARRDMERAIEELKKKEHEAASKHQDDALAKLRQAREKLEEILRQLREEERKLLLAALEARFQRMLQIQIRVYNGTVAVSRVPDLDMGRAKALAIEEQDIVTEADKALALLKEEGSSVAFPEAVEQLRADVLLIARRLHPDQPETDPHSDVGELTQAIEKDVIEALQELIEALQKEMEKAREKPPGPPGDGKPQDPALVDKLAELKMLRSLQLRINRRTKLVGRAVDGEQATEMEVVGQLRDLSQRQQRIQRATYDLATGRNQ